MRVKEAACRASSEQPRIGQKRKRAARRPSFLEFVSVCYDLEQEVVSWPLKPFRAIVPSP